MATKGIIQRMSRLVRRFAIGVQGHLVMPAVCAVLSGATLLVLPASAQTDASHDRLVGLAIGTGAGQKPAALIVCGAEGPEGRTHFVSVADTACGLGWPRS